ncbi:MAG: hypothetical protein LBS87_03370 [Puniceicoccales bacterium]|jgi:hypothetical protein|nr:hypothetical protein [Puniceicoccales bacterium]
MEEFVELFKNITKDKQTAKTIKDGISKAIECLDKTKEWLSEIPEEKFNEAIKVSGEKIREKLADMVRNGTINREYLEKAHRTRMIFPSDITRGWEEIANLYYDKYKNEVK